MSSQSPPRHGTSFAFPPPRARPVTATNRRPRGKNVGPIAKLKLHFLAVRQSRPVSRHRFSTCARTFAATHTRTARVRVMAETIERRQQRDTVASVHQRPINHRVGKRKKKIEKNFTHHVFEVDPLDFTVWRPGGVPVRTARLYCSGALAVGFRSHGFDRKHFNGTVSRRSYGKSTRIPAGTVHHSWSDGGGGGSYRTVYIFLSMDREARSLL